MKNIITDLIRNTKRNQCEIIEINKQLDNLSSVGITIKHNVLNYNELSNLATLEVGDFAYVQESQGTKWLPGSLGGTYYNRGIYYYDGVSWKTTEIPYQANLQQVNDGISNELFVTPYTLKNSDVKLNKYIEHVSAEIIPSYTPIAIVNNLAYKFDSQNINHKFAFAGFSTNGTLEGEICKIQQIGEVEFIGWNLIPNTQYVAGPNGTMLVSNTITNNFIKVLGYAVTPDKLMIIKDYTSVLKS